MSGSSRSLLLVLRRCVAVRQLTPAATLGTSGACGGVTQLRTWSSASRAVCLRGLGVLHPAATSRQSGFCTKTGSPCDNDYPPLPPYQSESEPETKEVYIVQVKGLPWSCTAQDLLQFFSECRIHEGEKGIHLTLDRLGRPSGQAFIEMEHEEDVSKALEKHRQYIGSRYVQVSEVTNRDAESILKQAVQTAAEHGVVLLRGLPFTCTEDDISAFFSGLAIVENGITIVADSRGRRSGEAFVQFSCQEAATEALRRDRQLIGSRYIEVFPSRRDNVESTLRRMRSPPSSQNFSPAAGRRTASASSTHSHNTAVPEGSGKPVHYVHMRGLPFQVTGEEIVKFFAPLIVSKIMIECGPSGRPNGEADVYFRCHQDALAAMSRDRLNIGHRYIELFLNSEPDSDGR
ncbi:G-rich sequence factor 1 [Salarias fasciatus]|uniref:RRM domain-containing protein n=1 Tax=Salarias fasciatus TaxID=181472 RepID=A0A672J3M6_SALFA|nr:G-rich sequence factor 1 [Salarias fasciatus]